MDTKEGMWMSWEIGVEINPLLILCILLITKENLLHSTEKSIQCSVVINKGYIYIYIYIFIYIYI